MTTNLPRFPVFRASRETLLGSIAAAAGEGELAGEEGLEGGALGGELLGDEGHTGEPGERVDLQEDRPPVGADHVGAGVALAAERLVRVERHLLRGPGDLRRDLRRGDLARPLAQVLSFVVERAA